MKRFAQFILKTTKDKKRFRQPPNCTVCQNSSSDKPADGDNSSVLGKFKLGNSKLSK